MNIKINTLHSLERVKDIYVITDDLKIVNTTNGYEKTLWLNKGGYPMVSLEVTDNDRHLNVPMHKIVALAFIENKESYELIEHLNDIKTDYSISNLRFSNHSNNMKNAFINGCANRTERIYKVTLNDGSFTTGTMKELSVQLHISKQTLYDNVYNNRNPKNFKSISLYED